MKFIEIENTRNQITFNLEWMHGDADAYSNTSFNIDVTGRSLDQVAAVVYDVRRAIEEHLSDSERVSADVLDKVNARLNTDHKINVCLEQEADNQSDGHWRATVEEINVTYCDNAGDMYNVTP